MKPFTHALGIDMGASTYTACISKAPGVPLHGPHVFDNRDAAFSELYTWLCEKGFDHRSIRVCMESTGVYGEALCYDLHKKGYRVAVEHPLKVKRAFDVGGHKTDAVDSIQIAEYALRFQDELAEWQPREEIVEQVNVLLSTREQLVKQKTRFQNNLHALSRKVVISKFAQRVLKKNIRTLAKDIISLEKEIDRLIDEHPSMRQSTNNLISHPGVGLLLAANLMIITNGYEHEPDPKQLASYLKICPFKHESGTSVYKKPTSKKYGPARMRKLLHLAARSLTTHQPEFRKYYHRKLAEGKPKKLVLNNVANKLVKILCAMIRDDKPYIKEYRSVNPRYLKTA